MKIMVISDIHGNLLNLKKTLNYANKEAIKTMFCAGDLGDSNTLKYLSANFKNQIYLVLGNADLYSESEVLKYKNIVFSKDILYFTIKNISFALCHQNSYIPKILSSENKVDYIFYGHTHRPDIKIVNKTIIANPGSLNDNLQRNSFAVLDLNNKKLKLNLC